MKSNQLYEKGRQGIWKSRPVAFFEDEDNAEKLRNKLELALSQSIETIPSGCTGPLKSR